MRITKSPIVMVIVVALVGTAMALFVRANSGNGFVSVDDNLTLTGQVAEVDDYIEFGRANVPDGFPTNEAEAAVFVRNSEAARQEIPYRKAGGGGGLGEGIDEIAKIVDLQGAVAKAAAMKPSAEFNVEDIVTGQGPEAAPNDRDPNGVFHVACTVSHFAYADPIVLPNQPGQAHLHMFFGNTQANAFSTSDTILNTGNSSCQHEELNRTAYWIPAVLDGDHYAVVPDYIQVYYESLGNRLRGDFRNYPAGLNFVSGDAFATSVQPEGTVEGRGASYFCGWYGMANYDSNPGGSSAGHSSTIPYCDPARYSHMQVNISSAYCWDGVNIDWSKDNPNVIYPNGGYYADCPASHPVIIPSLYYRLTFNIRDAETPTNTWYLSSDVDRQTGELRGPRGSSIHADWWNGWNTNMIDTIFDNCIDVTNRWCGPVHLGDGRLTNHIGKLWQVNDERISPEQLLTTCPLRSTFDGNPRNVAYCIN